MHRSTLCSSMLACLIFSACAPAGNSDWENVDYRSVYIRAQHRELDQYYQIPTIIGCMDDDLYNCQ